MIRPAFQRAFVAQLQSRLAEPRRTIQLLAGPRQVGKSTGVQQALGHRNQARVHLASADSVTVADDAWLRAQWTAARRLADGGPGAVLALDEIQLVPRWSTVVKGLWDEDSRNKLGLHVILLGSSALLLQKGLTESLAGRFEVLPVGHWDLAEEAQAFHWDLEQHLLHGGYPGLAHLIGDPERWRSQVRLALIDPCLERDVFAMSNIEKPALLRRLFMAACQHAAQVVSYNKLLGQLTDRGNSAILAHYQALLERAWLIVGLQKYSGSAERSRASSPKWLPLAPAMVTAATDRPWDEWARPGQARGQLVEAAVGAHLARQCRQRGWWLGYWADGNAEVDYIVKSPGRLWAIEVKSGRARNTRSLGLFLKKYPEATPLIVEGEGGGLKRFLMGELGA